MSPDRAREQQERGQALVVSAIFMTVLLGFAAFTIDFGRMAVTKRQLQNAADAGAHAGVWQLPDDTALAQSDALTWAQYNFPDATVTGVQVFTTNASNDSIRVTVQRTVDYTFGQVLGLTDQTLTAQAAFMRVVATGFPTSAVFPYAIWAGNGTPSNPQMISVGETVTFKANDYRNINVDPIPGCTNPPANNCNWRFNGNSFKGYFHWQSGSTRIYITPPGQYQWVQSQGGNAFGTSEYLERLAEHYATGTPAILPVINYLENPPGTGMRIRVIAFACVRITQFGGGGSTDWQGQITQCVGPGYYGEGTPPSSTVPSAGVAVGIE